MKVLCWVREDIYYAEANQQGSGRDIRSDGRLIDDEREDQSRMIPTTCLATDDTDDDELYKRMKRKKERKRGTRNRGSPDQLTQIKARRVCATHFEFLTVWVGDRGACGCLQVLAWPTDDQLGAHAAKK